MISDDALNPMLMSFAAELAERTPWPDGSVYDGLIHEAVFEPVEFAGLTMARVYAQISGPELRRRLAHAGALRIDAEAEVSQAVAGVFDYYARLLQAFARPSAPTAAGPRQVTIAATPARKLRDTIFERNAGKIGEKTGGLDLSPGQPISTADYAPQQPAHFAAPANLEQTMLEQRLAAAGFAPPLASEDEGTVARAVRARLGGAPDDRGFAKVRVPYPDDGKGKHGTIYIQRPPVLAANAPPPLRAAPAGAGPEVSPSPPEGEL